MPDYLSRPSWMQPMLEGWLISICFVLFAQLLWLRVFVLGVCVYMYVGATTTRDVINAVYWSVSRSTREPKRPPTSQCVNARIAPFSWPLGECHGVTCRFFVFIVLLYIAYSGLFNLDVLRAPAMFDTGLSEAWRRLPTCPTTSNCEQKTWSVVSTRLDH